MTFFFSLIDDGTASALGEYGGLNMQRHWTCPRCRTEMLVTISERLEHEAECQSQNITGNNYSLNKLPKQATAAHPSPSMSLKRSNRAFSAIICKLLQCRNRLSKLFSLSVIFQKDLVYKQGQIFLPLKPRASTIWIHICPSGCN